MQWERSELSLEPSCIARNEVESVKWLSNHTETIKQFVPCDYPAVRSFVYTLDTFVL